MMRNKAEYPEPRAHSFSISDVIKTNESRIVQDIYNEVKKLKFSYFSDKVFCTCLLKRSALVCFFSALKLMSQTRKGS